MVKKSVIFLSACIYQHPKWSVGQKRQRCCDCIKQRSSVFSCSRHLRVALRRSLHVGLIWRFVCAAQIQVATLCSRKQTVCMKQFDPKQLGFFTGTTACYLHAPRVLLTDGAKYVAEHAEAYWLMRLPATCSHSLIVSTLWSPHLQSKINLHCYGWQMEITKTLLHNASHTQIFRCQTSRYSLAGLVTIGC